jgi:hypothetical protein
MNTDKQFLQALAEIDESLKSMNEQDLEKPFVSNSFWRPCGGGAGGCGTVILTPMRGEGQENKNIEF